TAVEAGYCPLLGRPLQSSYSAVIALLCHRPQKREEARGGRYISREEPWCPQLASASLLTRLQTPTTPPQWPSPENGKLRARRGIPNDVIEKGRDYKLITEVTQDGDNFSWCQIYPTNARVTNNFTIGKECDMETIGGKKFKATVHMEGGKLTTAFPNYQHTTEISGGKLIETSTAASVVLKRTSKKI
uniref:Fatty acid binding protein 6, ileal (gastrotropin) n=1 Tax=Gasterosteus aculeatus aculeatus TaxID=481459 RepID=A0AAQ4R791_GASAC